MTEWKCPFCEDLTFASGPDFDLESVVDSHMWYHINDALDGLPVEPILEPVCKLADCNDVALWLAHAESECEHSQEPASMLCDYHKERAAHPAFRSQCSACLGSGIRTATYISRIEPLRLVTQ